MGISLRRILYALIGLYALPPPIAGLFNALSIYTAPADMAGLAKDMSEAIPWWFLPWAPSLALAVVAFSLAVWPSLPDALIDWTRKAISRLGGVYRRHRFANEATMNSKLRILSKSLHLSILAAELDGLANRLQLDYSERFHDFHFEDNDGRTNRLLFNETSRFIDDVMSEARLLVTGVDDELCGLVRHSIDLSTPIHMTDDSSLEVYQRAAKQQRARMLATVEALQLTAKDIRPSAAEWARSMDLGRAPP